MRRPITPTRIPRRRSDVLGGHAVILRRWLRQLRRRLRRWRPLRRRRAPGQRAGDAASKGQEFVVVGAFHHRPNLVRSTGRNARKHLRAAVAAPHLLGLWPIAIDHVATLATSSAKGAFAYLDVVVDDFRDDFRVAMVAQVRRRRRRRRPRSLALNINHVIRRRPRRRPRFWLRKNCLWPRMRWPVWLRKRWLWLRNRLWLRSCAGAACAHGVEHWRRRHLRRRLMLRRWRPLRLWL